MLEALAESGHVERVRSEVDRRIVVSRLTDSGRRQIEAKRALWQKRWEQVLHGVSERELRAATKVLSALAEMFEREA
jgi:DNA-binding MarR family transcriptional regulator